MKSKHIENGLALVAALIVLIGVSTAASSAFAAESSLDIELDGRISVPVVDAE